MTLSFLSMHDAVRNQPDRVKCRSIAFTEVTQSKLAFRRKQTNERIVDLSSKLCQIATVGAMTASSTSTVEASVMPVFTYLI